MDARQSEIIYRLPYMLYAPGCPAVIEGGCLVEAVSGLQSVLLQMRSLSNRAITGCMVRIQPQEGEGGRPWGDYELFVYDGLDVPRDGVFGAGQPLSLSEDAAGAGAFNAGIESVTFEDGSVWNGSKSVWGVISHPEQLLKALPSPEDAEKYKEKYGVDCSFLPKAEKDLWWCTCGAWPNHKSEKRCHKCDRPQTQLTPVALKKAGIKPPVNKKKRRITIACVSIIAAAALLVPAGTYAVEQYKMGEVYKEAARLYHAGEYEEAMDLFATIPEYKDADAWANEEGALLAAETIMEPYSADPPESDLEDAYEATLTAEPFLDGADPASARTQALQEKINSIRYLKAMSLLSDLTVRAGEPLGDMNQRVTDAADILEDIGSYRDAAETAQTLREEQLLFESAIESWRAGNFDSVIELAKHNTQYLRLDETLISLAEEFVPYIGRWNHAQGNTELLATPSNPAPVALMLSTSTQNDGEVYLEAYADGEKCNVSPFGADRSVFGFRSMSDPTVTMSIAPDGSLIVSRTALDGTQEDYAIYTREGQSVPSAVPDAVVPGAAEAEAPDVPPDAPADPLEADPNLAAAPAEPAPGTEAASPQAEIPADTAPQEAPADPAAPPADPAAAQNP